MAKLRVKDIAYRHTDDIDVKREHRQGLVEAFAYAAGGTGVVVVQALGEIREHRIAVFTSVAR